MKTDIRIERPDVLWYTNLIHGKVGWWWLQNQSIKGTILPSYVIQLNYFRWSLNETSASKNKFSSVSLDNSLTLSTITLLVFLKNKQHRAAKLFSYDKYDKNYQDSSLFLQNLKRHVSRSILNIKWIWTFP